MRILVIGGGAREHAICWKLTQGDSLVKLYCAPGNAGISKIAECIDIKAEDVDGIINFAVSEKIDLVVIGPEGPLVAGLTDMLTEKGIKTFGPDKKGEIGRASCRERV